MTNKDKKQPLFMISVAAGMLGVHPQTLRLYEREGLVTPRRAKRLRLYSEDDIERISFILNLTKELGVNKAGVEIILRMRHRLISMQKEMEEMMHFLEKDIRLDFERKLKEIFFREEL